MAKSTDKRYDDDWAKEKSREVVKRLIDRTLMTFRKPKQVSVLCFPGIDAREVTQVYDSMGIPRQNIIGLERDKRIAAEIEAKKLGIRVIPQSLEDYIDGQKEIDFDIVSLDYTQPIYHGQMLAIHSLLEKQKRKSFVLHVANSIRRDAYSDNLYQMGIRACDISHGRAVTDSEKERREKNSAIMVDRMESYEAKKEDGESRTFEKAHAYSRIVKSLFSGLGNSLEDPNATNCSPNPTIFKMERGIRYLAGEEYSHLPPIIIKNEIPGIIAAANEEERAKVIESFANLNLDPARPLTSLQDTFFASTMGSTIMTSLAQLRIEEIPQLLNSRCETTIRELAKFFNMMLFTALKDQNFFPNMAESTYSYISESGCPMIGDVYYLKKPVYLIDDACEALSSLGYPTRFNVNNLPRFAKAFRRFIERTDEEVQERIKLNGAQGYRDREFLGNASKPVLTKRKFLDELDAGHDAEYVREHYRGWRNKPLAQWQAHHTMGTYRDKPSAIEEDLGGEEDSDLERITKDEAIDMLSSGISIDEIRSAYPTSFTVGQLRAYKAHLTMGTYNEPGKQTFSAA